MLIVGGFFIFSLIFPSSLIWAKNKKPKISNPSKFKVNYSLKNKKPAQNGSKLRGAPGIASDSSIASIAVNILDERFYPVKTFVIRKIKKNKRMESLWDGRDIYGKEMPSGDYYASLSIIYSDGTKETRFFKFVKEK